jgi:hypothetical protein
VVVLLGRVEGHRVGAVVRHVLARLGGQQLQEAQLVAVRLVSEPAEFQSLGISINFKDKVCFHTFRTVGSRCGSAVKW